MKLAAEETNKLLCDREAETVPGHSLIQPHAGGDCLGQTVGVDARPVVLDSHQQYFIRADACHDDEGRRPFEGIVDDGADYFVDILWSAVDGNVVRDAIGDREFAINIDRRHDLKEVIDPWPQLGCKAQSTSGGDRPRTSEMMPDLPVDTLDKAACLSARIILGIECEVKACDRCFQSVCQVRELQPGLLQPRPVVIEQAIDLVDDRTKILNLGRRQIAAATRRYFGELPGEGA